MSPDPTLPHPANCGPGAMLWQLRHPEWHQCFNIGYHLMLTGKNSSCACTWLISAESGTSVDVSAFNRVYLRSSSRA